MINETAIGSQIELVEIKCVSFFILKFHRKFSAVATIGSRITSVKLFHFWGLLLVGVLYCLTYRYGSAKILRGQSLEVIKFCSSCLEQRKQVSVCVCVCVWTVQVAFSSENKQNEWIDWLNDWLTFWSGLNSPFIWTITDVQLLPPFTVKHESPLIFTPLLLSKKCTNLSPVYITQTFTSHLNRFRFKIFLFFLQLSKR
jgi:hypothetical protein